MLLRRAIFTQALCTALYILLLSKMSSAKSAAGVQSSAPSSSVDIKKACFNFTVGNPEKKEFYSPNYPNDYPPKIKCTKQITADFGHVVKLDFRDHFKMEESPTCEYDKLIVRDGPYAYSPEIKTICGKEFPNLITSSDRYLWLQFISDESIEMAGFKAVYQYAPINGIQKKPPVEECAFSRTGHAGIIRKEDIDETTLKYAEENESPIDCIWIITADHPQKVIYLNFNEFSLKYPNDCEKNFVDIYQSSRIDTDNTFRFCGTTAEPKKVESHIVHVRLFMHYSAYNSTKFKMHYTVLRNIKRTETCNALEFDCGDNTCIDRSLVCDKQPDCKYRYDEDACLPASVAGMVLTSEHMIIILVVFFALVVAMCASISISCYNKIQDRKAREREYKERRSKEASVEVTMDRAVRGHSSPDRGPKSSLASQKSQHLPRTHYPDDGDDESSDGCYVPEVDLSAFEKYPNGGGTIPRGPDGRSVSRGGIQSQYPFISHSTDSIESETIVPPAPPPVPMHLKERREPLSTAATQQPLSYHFVGGKAVPDVGRPKTPPADTRFKPVAKPDMDWQTASTLQRNRWPPEPKNLGTSTSPTKTPTEPKGLQESRTTRGPLEAGVPRSVFTRNPGDYGLPRFGVAKPAPETTKGPMAKATDKVLPLSIYKPPESYGNAPYKPSAYHDYKAKQDDRLAAPHQFRAQAKIEMSDRDSSRADSVDSIQSAPDVVAQR